MWPIILNAARLYAPYIVWPVAAVIGFVGYNFEKVVRGDMDTPSKLKSISEERDERMLQESQGKDVTAVESLKEKTFVPKTIFERNQTVQPPKP